MNFVCQRPSFWEEMRQRTQGAAVRRSRMNPEDLLDVEIDIPNLETQRAVVALLGDSVALTRSLEAEQQAAQALLVSARETLVGWAENDGAAPAA
jgi:type I restriction enzyme, S subunit